MAVPSDIEQLTLELINRARLDPGQEAARIGISLNQGLSPGTISNDSKQPLAFNFDLNDAAADHSRWMLATDIFSHTGAGGSDPGDRMAGAGYTFTGSWTWGENIAWNGTTGNLNVLQSALRAHDGLFDSAGHRKNMLNDSFREIGLGAETGNFDGYNAYMLTENFAKSGSGHFVTGVAYSDTNGDDFYSVGEGRGSVTVTLTQANANLGQTNTWSSGGFGVKTTATGDVDIAFSGGGLPGTVSARVELVGENAKVDLVGTDHIQSSVTTTLGRNADDLTLLGRDAIDGTGNAGANILTGNAGNNILDGGAGVDRLAGKAGNDTYIVDLPTDFVSEQAGQGTDLVRSNVNFTLRPNVENLTLLGTNNLQGIGNSENNILVGNSGANRLNGSTGADTMRGGGGNDIYSVDNAGDVIVEYAGQGIDTVFSFTSRTLGANVERLYLFGTADINGTGNGAQNGILGNAGDNVLSGGGGNDLLFGGLGNDTMAGGAGFDTFYFHTALDGTDNVETLIDFSHADDTMRLDDGVFTGLSTGLLSSNAFLIGTAARDANDRIIYNDTSGDLFFDADGSGAGAQVQFATLDDAPTDIMFNDFLVI